jgi:prevent-host-death family protein
MGFKKRQEVDPAWPPVRGRFAASPNVRGLAKTQKLATLMAMSVTEQMSLADVKNRLSEVVDRLQREHGRVVITKHGHPAAVVISLEDLESLEETLDVMDSAALLDDIREALADSDAQVLSKEDALRLFADR